MNDQTEEVVKVEELESPEIVKRWRKMWDALSVEEQFTIFLEAIVTYRNLKNSIPIKMRRAEKTY